ncbi:N-acetylmuramoyl-L-alanine amidase [Streptomyces atratus]|uniref:N-acetylmuramoyl-L-alanine amidase n=1 Tax=Streptomyces atratus TaxID=1893 RepID=UPI0033E8778A
MKSNGWNDIGYNFLVDKCGTLFEGRAGGIDKPVYGAHTYGFNTDTSGIAVLGDYNTATTTPVVRESIAKLAAWKLGLYGINPSGTVVMAAGADNGKFTAGQLVTMNRISGHRHRPARQTGRPGHLRGPAARPGGADGYSLRTLWPRHLHRRNPGRAGIDDSPADPVAGKSYPVATGPAGPVRTPRATTLRRFAVRMRCMSCTRINTPPPLRSSLERQEKAAAPAAAQDRRARTRQRPAGLRAARSVRHRVARRAGRVRWGSPAGHRTDAGVREGAAADRHRGVLDGRGELGVAHRATHGRGGGADPRQ